MTVQSFSEYRPDVSDYEGNTSKNIVNVVPRGDGYGPFPALFPFTAALPANCRGYFYARKNDGSIAAFAGTSTKLYQLNNTSQTWTDVSRSGGTYTALGTNAQWQFAQFNNYVFATQVNDKLQIFDLTSSSAFADRADSNCPQAGFVAVVNQFLVLTGIASPNVYRVQWSGLADVSSSSAFTSGVNSSDFQDLADGGIVRGIAGNSQMATVFQDAGIKTFTYAPGADYIFYVQALSQDDGIYAPYSLIRSGDKIFWVSPQGFKVLLPGGYPTPIGKERIDRTFFADVDTGNLQLVIGANDPTQTRVYFAYKSQAGAAGQFDKMLVYDWALDKWTPLIISGEYLASLSKPGITLEGVDAAYGTGTPVAATSLTTAGVWTIGVTGASVGRGVQITSSGTLPSGYTAGTPYYVNGGTFNTFTLSASGGVGALAGPTITSSSTGSGTLYYAVESIETLNLSSLDAISNAALSQLSGISASGALGFFTGGNLQATLETPEHGGDGRRIFVRGARVVSDAPTINVQVSGRESPQAAQTYTAASSIDARGFAPQRLSTRYSRTRVVIPSGTSWTFAAGVEPDVAPEGLR